MKKNLILLLFIVLKSIGFSQGELKFEHYSTHDGLVNNEVLSICQDNFGFLWFGTKNGISRFDGIDFKNWVYNENGPDYLGQGWVNEIRCDADSQIWISLLGKKSTLMFYDYSTDKFIDYSSKIKEKLNDSREQFDIWTFFFDQDGNLWFEPARRGIMCYNPKTDEIKHITKPATAQQGYNQVPVSIKDFLVDDYQNILMAAENGMFIYNKEEKNFTAFQHDPQDLKSISADQCDCIYQDSEKHFWIGTSNGLNKFVPYDADKPENGGTFKKFKHNPEDPFSMPSGKIVDVIEDKNKNLLIATINGLYVLNTQSDIFYRCFHDELDQGSINSNIVRKIYIDSKDNIWAATNWGVDRMQIKNFSSYSHSSYKNSISHNKVEAVCNAPDNNLWIATPKGIDLFDRALGKFKLTIDNAKGKNSIHNVPIALFPDSDKGLWIGTWGGGVSYYDYSHDKVKNYIDNSTIKKFFVIYSLFADSKNNLWFSEFGKGVVKYNLMDQTFKIYQSNIEKGNALSSNLTYCVLEDSHSNIWIGAINGLNRISDINDRKTEVLLEGIQINVIIENNAKNLWIGTSNGLYVYHSASQKIIKVHPNSEGFGVSIAAIQEDNNNRLWVSTDKGLASLDITNDTIVSANIYREEEGASVGNFIPRSGTQLDDGTIVFGGTRGFCMFHPENVKHDTIPPSVVFTSLKIAGKDVGVGDTINKQVILSESITTAKHLLLNYKNNEFAVGFAGLQFNMPQYNTYAFRLEGYDRGQSDWHYVTANEREAAYMNLPAGEYKLRVKAANSYGVWSKKDAMLYIEISPPWWETWWFRIVCFSLLVLIVVLIVQLRTRNLQKKKQKLEKIVAQRTVQLQEMNVVLEERKDELEQQAHELEAQAHELSYMNLELRKTNINLEEKTTEVERIAKQFHEADQSKLRFFANISHEFRTPLTLIIGPLEKFIQLKQPIDWNRMNILNYLQLMHRNSKRLLRLVNQIIEFRKIDQGKLKFRPSDSNIVEFINDVAGAFQSMAEAKGIQLKVMSEELRVKSEESNLMSEELRVKNEEISDTKQLFTHHSSLITQFWFDPDIMEKILYNLISNAIKYTPEGGQILIAMNVTEETRHALSLQPQLAIKISDTGIGINPENLNKIFDRFYTVETRGRSSLGENQTEGTGIGLAYTKELVELHNGTISVISKPNIGTTFTLEFPVEPRPVESNKLPIEGILHPGKPYNLDYIHSMIGELEIPQLKSESQADEIEKKQKNGTISQTILIVEDNIDLKNFIKEELEPHYQIIEAGNGKIGLEKAMKDYPDLIISDIMMPVMDGIELCKILKSDKNTSHIPVILLTAKIGEDNMLKGLETGADDYIPKPFNVNILKAKIKNLFMQQKRLQEKFSKSIDVPVSEVTNTLVDKEFLEKAIQVVHDNMSNMEFGYDEFVNLMGWSKSVIYRKVKKLTGQSPGEFIRTLRLKAATRMFAEGNDNISDVCFLVGFKTQSFFTRHFGKMFGKTPGEFIKERFNK